MDNRSIIDFLDNIRGISQIGLNYSKDSYDRQRYLKILELCSKEYSAICDLPKQLILERFQNELGYITPKVGVNGVVFSETGQILLEKRSDDQMWGIPGGWAEIGETVREAIKREFWEETGLVIEVGKIIDIFSRRPGDFGQPHSSYHILFLCRYMEGELKISSESLELGFYDYRQIQNWHRDHFIMAQTAYNFFNENKKDFENLIV